MKRPRSLRLAAIALLSLAALSPARGKPDLSGTWKLNLDKSDYGMMKTQAPDKLVRTITHVEPNLKFVTTQGGVRGDVTSEMAYTTDGKPSVNKTVRGEVTGAAKWDGDVLTITSKREVSGAAITQNERWSLSADGKTLTIINRISMPVGDSEIRLVLEKQ